jgi:hypothetical protein
VKHISKFRPIQNNPNTENKSSDTIAAKRLIRMSNVLGLIISQFLLVADSQNLVIAKNYSAALVDKNSKILKT